MSDHDWEDSGPQVLPMSVSVSFKPEALTTVEEWRMVLTRIDPTSKRPVFRTVVGTIYVMFAMATFGFLLGMAGWPNLRPETMSVAFLAWSMLIPLRLWRIKRQLVGVWKAHSPMSIQVDEESATTLSKHRVTRIDWEGVLELRTNSREVVLRYRAGDASWIPRRAFADHEHEARFLEVAADGLARSRSAATSHGSSAVSR